MIINYNARAQTLFSSLKLLFNDVAVAVVVFLGLGQTPYFTSELRKIKQISLVEVMFLIDGQNDGSHFGLRMCMSLHDPVELKYQWYKL